MSRLFKKYRSFPKNGSDFHFCRCVQCLYSARTKRGSKELQKERRRYRRIVKQLIKQGRFELLPTKWSAGRIA
jgi:hypothetical protein